MLTRKAARDFAEKLGTGVYELTHEHMLAAGGYKATALPRQLAEFLSMPKPAEKARPTALDSVADGKYVYRRAPR